MNHVIFRRIHFAPLWCNAVYIFASKKSIVWMMIHAPVCPWYKFNDRMPPREIGREEGRRCETDNLTMKKVKFEENGWRKSRMIHDARWNDDTHKQASKYAQITQEQTRYCPYQAVNQWYTNNDIQQCCHGGERCIPRPTRQACCHGREWWIPRATWRIVSSSRKWSMSCKTRVLVWFRQCNILYKTIDWLTDRVGLRPDKDQDHWLWLDHLCKIDLTWLVWRKDGACIWIIAQTDWTRMKDMMIDRNMIDRRKTR